jgi:flagellar motor protein MotB
MARWEDFADSDMGPYAKPRGTRWGRVFTGLLVLGFGTFVAAYYLPLYRAQQRLNDQYRELSQKSQNLEGNVSKVQADLKSVSAERDQLRTEHDKRDSAQKTDASQQDRLRDALSTKLDKQIKKNGAAVVANGGTLIVALDSALLFQPQKLDLTATAATLLCDINKTSEAKSVTVSAALAPGSTVPAALAKTFATAWALSAARAAALAEALVDKCALPAAQVSATGSADHDPFAMQFANSKLPADRVELVLGSH